MERKLSTIFALDLVGFSKMMARDEEKTLRMLKQRRHVIDGLIAEYGGEVFGSAGDSVIAEFSSPIKATECAVQIQGKMQALNEDEDEDSHMIFRVGINIGDVMVSENNLFGDAVNIASRLEAASRPSGVCISRPVFDMVSQKIKVSFEDAGYLELKNIPDPVQAFYVIQSKGGIRYIQNTEAPQIKVKNIESGSLAVMLFKSLSTDEEQAYFCEGFSEDLISALSRFKKLVLTSGNASFAYRDKSKSPKEIGNELGVKYLLEGSVRKLGQKMRINASLISTDRETTVWSNKFDTTVEEIFDMQDELVEVIVSTIVGRVEADAVQQLSNSRPENFSAYDLLLKGLEFHRRNGLSGENAKKAYDLFCQAIKVDPLYARPYAWKTCAAASVMEWFPDDSYDDDHVEKNIFGPVKKAMELDPNDPEGHRIMGAIELDMNKDFEKARYHHERAIELCPSDSYLRARYATLLIFLGDPEEALNQVHRAMRTDPFCPDFLFEDEGMSHFWLEQFDDAIESFSKLKVQTRNSLFYIAATYSKKGMFDKASESLKQAIATMNYTIERFVKSQTYQDSSKSDELKNVLESIPV